MHTWRPLFCVAHGVDAQGTGQIAHAAAPGDGFITDSEIINSYKGKKFSTTRYTIEGKCAAHTVCN